MNVQMRVHIQYGTWNVHNEHQKKIALEIAAKIASVNRPYLSHKTHVYNKRLNVSKRSGNQQEAN
jgi:hypothetical protein